MLGLGYLTERVCFGYQCASKTSEDGQCHALLSSVSEKWSCPKVRYAEPQVAAWVDKGYLSMSIISDQVCI